MSSSDDWVLCKLIEVFIQETPPPTSELAFAAPHCMQPPTSVVAADHPSLPPADCCLSTQLGDGAIYKKGRADG
jgi:hypothetical protein